MFDHDTPCPGGNHKAPKAGGSCPCGMVTRIPARRPAVVEPQVAPPSEVLALLTQCLDDGVQTLDATTISLLRARADRLLSALTTAGLVLSAGAEVKLSA